MFTILGILSLKYCRGSFRSDDDAKTLRTYLSVSTYGNQMNLITWSVSLQMQITSLAKEWVGIIGMVICSLDKYT